MELYVSFKVRDLTLPLAYNYYVQGMIYNLLRSDIEFSTFLHDRGIEEQGKHFKHFTFGQLRGNSLIRDKQIIFKDYFTLEIRSSIDKMILTLQQELTHGRQLLLHGQPIFVDKCTVFDRQVQGSEVLIHTLSPICVHTTLDDGHTIYYTPRDNEFYDGIIANAMKKYGANYPDMHDFFLNIAPNPANRFRRIVTRYKNMYVTAWHGSFVLRGADYILKLLYDTGIGTRNSQGFGMFEIDN